MELCDAPQSTKIMTLCLSILPHNLIIFWGVNCLFTQTWPGPNFTSKRKHKPLLNLFSMSKALKSATTEVLVLRLVFESIVALVVVDLLGAVLLLGSHVTVLLVGKCL